MAALCRDAATMEPFCGVEATGPVEAKGSHLGN